MKMTAIKKYAADLGVPAEGLLKAELIRAIQSAEGNTPCFGQNTGACPYDDCLWLKDCRQDSGKHAHG